jgi:hypothetical protein
MRTDSETKTFTFKENLRLLSTPEVCEHQRQF